MKIRALLLRLVLLMCVAIAQTSIAAAAREPTQIFESGSDDAACSFTPDGKSVLVGGRLYDVKTGDLLHVFEGRKHNAISSDGKTAVTDSSTNRVTLWDLASRQAIRTFEGPGADIWGLALSADGRQVAIIGSDSTFNPNTAAIFLYAPGTGELLRTIEVPDVQWDICSFPVFSPDGSILAVCRTFDVLMWRMDTGQTNGIFELHYFAAGAAFSPDGRQFATTTAGNRTCRLWDLASRQQLAEWEGSGHDVKFSPDGRFLALGGFAACEGYTPSRIMSLATGREVRRDLPPASRVAWSPDGNYVVLTEVEYGCNSTGRGRVATLWDVRDIVADLRMVTSVDRLEARWDVGTLQYAATLDGEWMDLPVKSPLRLSTLGQQGYFRVVLNSSQRVAIVRNFRDVEIDIMEQYLVEMGLEYAVFDQEGLSFRDVQDFSLIVWDDLSFQMRGLTDNDVEIFQTAFDSGISLYFIGNDLALASVDLTPNGLTKWIDLLHLRLGDGPDSNGTVTIVNTTHPVINGPFGLVAGFRTFDDIDDAQRTGTGEVLLGTLGTTDVILAVEEPARGRRSVTQNHTLLGDWDATPGVVEPDAQAERKKLFKNAVAWLLSRAMK